MRYHSGWLSVLSVLMLSVLSTVLTRQATPSPLPWNGMLVKHKWDAIPENWVSLGQPPNGTTVKLHIALKANHENSLIDALHDVSHPRHPKYGAHLSREQVAKLIAPHPDTLELVCSWLKYNGVLPSSISTTHGDSWLTVIGLPVSQANTLLGASYELYYHAYTNETILRTIGYALPAALHTHIQTVVPTTAFTSMRLLQQTPRRRPGGEAANVTSGERSDVPLRRDDPSHVMPSFLRWLYRMPDYYPAAAGPNMLGIAGFGDERPDPIDQFLFMSEYRSDTNPNVVIVNVMPVNDGADNESPPGERGNLDTQYSVALTFPTPVLYYTVGGTRDISDSGDANSGDQYFEWLRNLTNEPIIPQTISVPYFTREPDLPPEYTNRLCLMFAQLGSRGVSVLAASGDDGVGSGKCKDTSGKFYTVFPASCPHVTSVGGTTSFDPELGSDFSGGGFSTHFERPEYQNEAVPLFLQKLESMHAGLYNPWGRGVPDIAVQSMKYALFVKGETFIVSSTGCATNTAAAIIALLNDFLISRGKPSLGFLNYWLYEAGLYWDGLNDVMDGKNPGCKTEGFFATDGWDPVTGLGSLNYTLLQRHLIEWL